MIPVGAGLGGGSSDAAFLLKAANDFFELNIPISELLKLAGELGSDCPFFIKNTPVFAEGTGTVFSPIELDLSAYRLVVVKPSIHVPTKLAYQNVNTGIPERSLKTLIKLPVGEWKNCIVNDFERSIFSSFPEIEHIKNQMYDCGAVYAQMSGSGSAVFGIFETKPVLPSSFGSYFVYEQ
jgi:4-diphosphocytidyl-2-C-methyl-D-erythritol kinase